jgi:hypothetical protein
MFPIQYKIGSKTYQAQVKNSWSELNEREFLPVIKYLGMVEERPEAKYMLPLLCSNIPQAHYELFGDIAAEQLLANLSFLYRFDELPSQWLVPKLTVQKKWTHQALFGPKEKLKNIVFEEFMFAESFLDAYYQKKDLEHLYKFAAILFRPKGGNKNTTGDIREPFNRHTVDARAELIKKIDMGVLQAIVLNYNGCKAHMMRLFPYIFVPNETEDNAPEADQESPQKSFSWLEASIKMADFRQSELENIQKANLYGILQLLNTKLKDNEQMKVEIQKMRTK